MLNLRLLIVWLAIRLIRVVAFQKLIGTMVLTAQIKNMLRVCTIRHTFLPFITSAFLSVKIRNRTRNEFVVGHRMGSVMEDGLFYKSHQYPIITFSVLLGSLMYICMYVCIRMQNCCCCCSHFELLSRINQDIVKRSTGVWMTGLSEEPLITS